MTDDQNLLPRLCWLVETQRQAEIAYQRAKWQLSYYKKSNAVPKKIEEMRLQVLAQQMNLLEVRNKLRAKIGIVRNKLKAVLRSHDGVVVGIKCPIDVKHTSLASDWRELDADQIAEMSDQYEADKVFNKVLSK